MSETTANGFLIKQIHDALEKRANNELRSTGLTMMQVSVLLALSDAEGQTLSMKALERRFGIAQSTVVGIVSRLEQKGLAEALSDEADKRIKLVHITESGNACCGEAAIHMREAEKLLIASLSDEECCTLNALLTKVLESLR